MLRSVSLLSVCVALSCGGADQSPLLGGDGGEGPPDSSGVDASTNDTGGPADVTVSDVIGIKDVVTVDVPIGPADSKIQCGPTLKCSAQKQVCCDHTSSATQYECVTDLSSCNGPYDVPISCSGAENCASQGTPSYICCANTTQGQSCTVATDVSCMATCDTMAGQTKVGCSSTDPCPTDTPTCKQSTCTLYGYYICAP